MLIIAILALVGAAWFVTFRWMAATITVIIGGALTIMVIVCGLLAALFSAL